MTNQIVTVNVSVTGAPTPSNLQQKGAFISQGGTSEEAKSLTLITKLSDLTSIIRPNLALSSLTWATGTVTATAAVSLGMDNGTTFDVTIAGAVPTAYNGTFAATVTGADTFTYSIVSDPGAETAPGTWVPASAAELLAMGTTFFAQGAGQSVYVLELGPTTAAQGVTELSSFITAQEVQQIYSYLVPRSWADEATYLTFLADYEADTSKTYFFTTVTLENYTDFTAAMKCVFAWIDSPDALDTEFGAAAPFYTTLHYRPSAAARVTPTAFAFLYGVTVYPSLGNGATFTALKAANVNYAGSGSEGGLSNVVLFWGTLLDGHDFTYWYSIDWVQINIELTAANEIINGSNNPTNPLYYDQKGINRLQGRAAGTMSNGVTYGLIYGSIIQTELNGPDLQAALDAGIYAGYAVVNAIPFSTYVAANPSDYSSGTYTGFTIVYTPNRGFKQIVFNLNVSDFVAA